MRSSEEVKMNEKLTQDNKNKHFKHRQDLAFHLNDTSYRLTVLCPAGSRLDLKKKKKIVYILISLFFFWQTPHFLYPSPDSGYVSDARPIVSNCA